MKLQVKNLLAYWTGVSLVLLVLESQPFAGYFCHFSNCKRGVLFPWISKRLIVQLIRKTSSCWDLEFLFFQVFEISRSRIYVCFYLFTSLLTSHQHIWLRWFTVTELGPVIERLSYQYRSISASTSIRPDLTALLVVCINIFAQMSLKLTLNWSKFRAGQGHFTSLAVSGLSTWLS